MSIGSIVKRKSADCLCMANTQKEKKKFKAFHNLPTTAANIQQDKAKKICIYRITICSLLYMTKENSKRYKNGPGEKLACQFIKFSFQDKLFLKKNIYIIYLIKSFKPW